MYERTIFSIQTDESRFEWQNDFVEVFWNFQLFFSGQQSRNKLVRPECTRIHRHSVVPQTSGRVNNYQRRTGGVEGSLKTTRKGIWPRSLWSQRVGTLRSKANVACNLMDEFVAVPGYTFAVLAAPAQRSGSYRPIRCEDYRRVYIASCKVGSGTETEGAMRYLVSKQVLLPPSALPTTTQVLIS